MIKMLMEGHAMSPGFGKIFLGAQESQGRVMCILLYSQRLYCLDFLRIFKFLLHHLKSKLLVFAFLLVRGAMNPKLAKLVCNQWF